MLPRPSTWTPRASFALAVNGSPSARSSFTQASSSGCAASCAGFSWLGPALLQPWAPESLACARSFNALPLAMILKGAGCVRIRLQRKKAAGGRGGCQKVRAWVQCSLTLEPLFVLAPGWRGRVGWMPAIPERAWPLPWPGHSLMVAAGSSARPLVLQLTPRQAPICTAHTLELPWSGWCGGGGPRVAVVS